MCVFIIIQFFFFYSPFRSAFYREKTTEMTKNLKKNFIIVVFFAFLSLDEIIGIFNFTFKSVNSLKSVSSYQIILIDLIYSVDKTKFNALEFPLLLQKDKQDLYTYRIQVLLSRIGTEIYSKYKKFHFVHQIRRILNQFFCLFFFVFFVYKTFRLS